jgi:dGTPase
MEPARFADDRPDVDDPGRSPYERDQDRVIYRTAFRRLAGKTQVFPLPQSDATHNRLTHTLEVATVGRSLGRLVAAKTLQSTKDSKLQPADVGAAAGAACLAHDIGNPPFGHAGEAAIAEYFATGNGRNFIGNLSVGQKADFCQFEGNALGFRILTHTHPRRSNRPGGLHLTYATLGAFLKYPRLSWDGDAADRSARSGASDKKFCAFQTDGESLRDIATKLHLKEKSGAVKNRWHRHPLAFVVEAADDICNRVIDLEDSFRARLVTEVESSSLLIAAINTGESVDPQRLDGIHDPNERMGYLRARAINVLVNQAADRFVENEAEISNGTFDESLVHGIPASSELVAMETLMKRCVYNDREVVAVEAAGFEVLSGLLDAFLFALLREPKSQRTNTLLSLAKGYPFEAPDSSNGGVYDTVMDVVEYVAGMTDSYAIDLYRTLRGIELPNY